MQSSLQFTTQTGLRATGAKSFAMKKTIAQQVRAYMEARGADYSPSDMAADVAKHQLELPARLRCKRQNIEQLLEKDFATTRYLVALASAMGTSAEILSAGRYVQSNAAITAKEATTPSHRNTEPGPDMRGKVPLISWVQAGDWCHAADPHLPGEADRWMDCPVNHSDNTFALRVRGDSMTAPHGNSRSYPEGCFIFVDPEKRTPVNGDRVVACLSGTDEVTFKVYKNEDGRQWLQPLNPSHEPIRESFHIIGTVLGKWEDG